MNWNIPNIESESAEFELDLKVSLIDVSDRKPQAGFSWSTEDTKYPTCLGHTGCSRVINCQC